MGNKQSNEFNPSINVRERHIHAIYINIPINKQQLQSFTCLPCECDEYNQINYISIILDDLDTLESYFNGIYINLSNYIRGWMCKVNILVKCEVPVLYSNRNEIVSGYQIISLDFEKGLSGELKKFGALKTQIIPTVTSTFRMTSGISGLAINYPLRNNEKYIAEMISNENENNINENHLVKLVGKLNTNLSSEQLNFAKFVINRPHKFLYQNFGTENGKLAYSPEIGDGANFECENCVWVDIEEINLPILNRLNERFNATLDISQIQCFIQPSYTLVDHHNTILTSNNINNSSI